MKALAIVGLVLVASVVLLAYLSIEDYKQHFAYQTEANEEANECAELNCFGMGLDALDAKLYYQQSMYELFVGMTLGSVGLIFLGLNIRDLAKPAE
ncbi:hypothetical protein [Nitrososphaera sp.]|uniref:hypothetical protein n=1 Tax=Nitrososphaera sp. TaxID=1971748 RepID=UPI002EDAEB4B